VATYLLFMLARFSTVAGEQGSPDT